MAMKVSCNGGTQSYCDRPNGKVYVAIAYEIPEISKRYICYVLEFINEQPNLIAKETSTVKEINYMGNGIYEVITNNSTYIVKVRKLPS